MKKHAGMSLLLCCFVWACSQPNTNTSTNTDAGTEAQELPDTVVGNTEVSTGTGQPDSVMRLKTVSDAEKRLAICNNGKPFTYYYRQGTSSGKDKWIVFLQGGGGCASVEECKKRWESDQGKMVPASNPTKQGSGIQNVSAQKNPDFYNYHHVFLEYCSSDGWMGDREASTDTGNFHFRGHRIVTAIIEDLKNASLYPNGTIDKAQLVIFAGGSAGGEGQISNLDRVASMLLGVKVLGVTDSYYHPNVKPYPGPPDDLDVSTSTGVSYNFWKSQVDESCAKDNPKYPWACQSGTYVYKYLETPNFVYEDQFDENRMRELGVLSTNPEPPITCKVFSKEQAAYLIPYSKKVRDTFATSVLKWGGGFSTAVGYHTALTHDDRYFVTKVDGKTFAEVLSNWIFDRPGPKLVVDNTPCP